MRYRIHYQESAINDIRAIREFIEQKNSDVFAAAAVEKVVVAIRILANMPKRGQKNEINPKYRQIIIGRYLVLYIVDERREAIEIHRILDSRRNIKKELE